MKYLHLVWAALGRRKVRTGLTLLSILVAFLLFGLLESVNSVFGEAGNTVGSAHRLITVARTGLFSPMPVSLKAQIRTVPGVEAVTGYSFFGGTYQNPKQVIGSMFAVGHNFFDLYPEFKIAPAALQKFDTTQTGAIVGAALAKRYHWKIGDQIPIKAMIYPRKGGSYTWTFDLVGIYHARSPFQEQDFLLRMRYFNEAAAFGNNRVGLFVEKIADPQQAGRVAAAIDALSANSGHATKTQSDSAFAVDFLSQFVDIGLIMHAIMGAVFFTLMLLTGNTMAQAVRERTPELAVLKTLGFSNGAVLSLVLGESVVLVLAGGALGLAAAALAVHLLQGQVGSSLPMMPVGGAIWLRGAILMVLIGMLVGALPARRGMRLRIVDALAGR